MEVSSKPKVFRILSVDGGGYLGLSTAVFISQIEKHFSLRFSDVFDLYCGTSTGAIISTALALGKSGDELVSLYQKLGPDIFGQNKSLGIFKAKYSLERLKSSLGSQIGDITIGDLQQRHKKLLITAFNRTTGKPRIFKTDHSDNLSTDNGLSILDVVLASASAPSYFPSHSIENTRTGLTEVFCDGGVASNHPALLGFTEAAYELKKEPSCIRLLSLSTPRQSLAQGSWAINHLDIGKWKWKDSIHNIFIDSNSTLVHETLKRLIDLFGESGPRYVRIELDNKMSLKIDDISEKATDALTAIGSVKANQQRIRKDIASIIE